MRIKSGKKEERKNRPVPYSETDVKTLRQFSKARIPTATIAELMGRSVGSLQQKCQRLGIPLGHRPYGRFASEVSKSSEKPPEQRCRACDGRGAPAVKQPALPDRRIYAAPCKKCGGKGRVVLESR